MARQLKEQLRLEKHGLAITERAMDGHVPETALHTFFAKQAEKIRQRIELLEEAAHDRGKGRC
jgi:hypothetical protein